MSFELLADEAAYARLADWEPRFRLAHDDPRARAHALCAVTVGAHGLGNDRLASGSLRFSRDDRGRVALDGVGVAAVIERTAPGRYAVSARIADHSASTLALMRGVSAAIVHEEGGVVLHAAAVELGGRALLFVGPSGAGKSTAVTLTDGGRCFAFDHVAVMPGEDLDRPAYAWGLPGGTPASAPLAPGIVHPLAAVLRVRRRAGLTRPELARAFGTDALFIVRESLECTVAAAGDEELYLRNAERLCACAPVGFITTVLGQPHAGLVASWPALEGLALRGGEQ